MKKEENKNLNIEKIRHSMAHLLAVTVLEKYPNTKLGIGPVIENGFYYDFDFGKNKIADTELIALEKKIKELIKQKLVFKKEIITTVQAKKLFTKQPYKLELIKDLVKDKQKISIYKTFALKQINKLTNSQFTDLCAGPHIKNSGEINPDAFKLTKIAGAYWKGSEKNQMLTRIYGVAFETKKELDEYLKMMEEAEKRDHRVLGEKLGLFTISEEVGKGLPLWLPKGSFIRKKLEDYMYEKELEYGYKYVYTPVLTKKGLYETSGHLAHYREDMYSPIDIEGEEYYLRPMNCPHHHMIYKHKPLSYRELPLRLAEFGLVHRFERSGVLTGLIRARSFTQNDSHIYCAKEQLKDELRNVLKLFDEVYKDFGIDDYWFRLSLPDFKNKEKYGDVNDKKMWKDAGDAARDVLKELKAKFVEIEGEATFYGPKIDIQTKNVLNKEDTIATCQIDFYSAKKFDLHFINKNGEKEYPAIIHRAIMGSFDRFFAFLTEKVSGNFPLWLSPVQVVVLNVGLDQLEYTKGIVENLKENGVRVELRDNDSLGKRIRQAELEKIPYVLVVGDKEIQNKTVNIRHYKDGQIGEKTFSELLEKIKLEIKKKA